MPTLGSAQIKCTNKTTHQLQAAIPVLNILARPLNLQNPSILGSTNKLYHAEFTSKPIASYFQSSKIYPESILPEWISMTPDSPAAHNKALSSYASYENGMLMKKWLSKRTVQYKLIPEKSVIMQATMPVPHQNLQAWWAMILKMANP